MRVPLECLKQPIEIAAFRTLTEQKVKNRNKEKPGGSHHKKEKPVTTQKKQNNLHSSTLTQWTLHCPAPPLP